MTKKLAKVIAILLSICGWALTIYLGGYWLLFRPIRILIIGFTAGTLCRRTIIICAIKIFLSATVAGAVWTGFDILAGIFRDIANGREE